MSTDQFYRDAGTRLRKLRSWLGHSPRSFADRLGLGREAYLAYERGNRRSRGWTRFMLRLSGETGVSLDWLFAGDGGEDVPRRVGGQPLSRSGEARP